MLAEPRDARRSNQLGSVPGISTSTASEPGGDRAPRSTMPTDLRRRCRSRGSVCETKAWRGRLHDYAVYLVNNYPSVCLTASQVFSNLRHLVNIFTHCRVDHEKSRAASEADGCFLLAELSARKGFRSIVNIEPRELRPSRLVLAAPCGRVVRVACKLQRRRSLALVYSPAEQTSIDFVELRSSNISQSHLFMKHGNQLSGNLRHGQISYYQLIDYPSRKLTIQETEMNVYFSSVGVHLMCAVFVRCEALCMLVFLENWIEVPEAEGLIHCCAENHGTSKAYIDELSATVDSCYVLDDIDELVLSHRACCTYVNPHGFAAFFAAVADRCTPIKTFEMCNFDLNNADLRDFSSALSGSAKIERSNFTCTVAAAGLQFPLAPVTIRKATLAKIHVSISLAPGDNVGEITKVIGGDQTLKMLSFSLKVNLTEDFLSPGMEKQPGLANFSKQIGVRGHGSRAAFEGFYAVIDSLVAYLQKGPKTWQTTFETPVPLSWPLFNKPISRPCGNAYLTRLGNRVVTVIESNLAVRLSVFASCGNQRKAPLALVTEMSPSMTLVRDMGKSRSLCSLIFSGWTFDYHAATTLSDVLCTTSTLNHLVSSAVLPQSGVFLLIKL